MKKMVLLILGVILSVVALPAPSASGSVACEGTNKKVTINWYGKERVFHIYSPAADSNESRPTVFGFHGATEIESDAKPECRNCLKEVE